MAGSAVLLAAPYVVLPALGFHGPAIVGGSIGANDGHAGGGSLGCANTAGRLRCRHVSVYQNRVGSWRRLRRESTGEKDRERLRCVTSVRVPRILMNRYTDEPPVRAKLLICGTQLHLRLPLRRVPFYITIISICLRLPKNKLQLQ